MNYDIGCVLGEGGYPKLPSESPALLYEFNQDDSPCVRYQRILEEVNSTVLIYVHNDVVVHDDDWITRIIDLFEFSDSIVAVGIGGATSLANPDLYRKQFNINNMARSGYASNQDDAEVHGERFTGVRRVAVLDAFCMAVRTDWLKSIGGWPVQHLTHHCLDLWLACEAARHHKEIWMAGISCLHKGGGTSTGESYAKAKWLQGGTRDSDHLLPHKWLFENYRDVLPIEIP